jgi:hypothetical protein
VYLYTCLDAKYAQNSVVCVLVSGYLHGYHIKAALSDAVMSSEGGFMIDSMDAV